MGVTIYIICGRISVCVQKWDNYYSERNWKRIKFLRAGCVLSELRYAPAAQWAGSIIRAACRSWSSTLDATALSSLPLLQIDSLQIVLTKNMGNINVYEACSKEETKTQYHFSIISNATVMGDSSLMELKNKLKMEFLVKKEGATEAAASH